MFGRVVGPWAVLVMACVLSQDSVFGCRSCRSSSSDSGDGDGDGDGGKLAARASQLQESNERLQQQVTEQHALLNKQKLELTAKERTITFLRNEGMSLLYHLVGANVT